MPVNSFSVLWWGGGCDRGCRRHSALVLCTLWAALLQPRTSRNYTRSCVWGSNTKKGASPVGREKTFSSCSPTEQTLPAAHPSHHLSAGLSLILVLRLLKKGLSVVDLLLTAWPNFPGNRVRGWQLLETSSHSGCLLRNQAVISKPCIFSGRCLVHPSYQKCLSPFFPKEPC